MLKISQALVSQSEFSVGPILILDASCFERLFQIMFVTLDGVLVIAEGLVTAAEVAEGAAFFEIVVFTARKGGRVF